IPLLQHAQTHTHTHTHTPMLLHKHAHTHTHTHTHRHTDRHTHTHTHTHTHMIYAEVCTLLCNPASLCTLTSLLLFSRFVSSSPPLSLPALTFSHSLSPSHPPCLLLSLLLLLLPPHFLVHT